MEHVQQWAQLRVRLWREYTAEHHRDDAIRTCFFECSRARPGRKTTVTPDGQAHAPTRVRSDPALVKALARAFRWQRLLDEGRYGSITEMARAEKIERGFLGRILRLALLAPDLVEAMLNGTQGRELSLPGLLEGVPVVWSEQGRVAQSETRGPEQPRPLSTQPGRRAPRCPVAETGHSSIGADGRLSADMGRHEARMRDPESRRTRCDVMAFHKTARCVGPGGAGAVVRFAQNCLFGIKFRIA